jgi:uncharacterized protein with HEPN domain
MDFQAFREDSETVAAVERKLQVISEAAVRLGSDAEANVPNVPWRDIRGIGNWLRHQYDRVELETIWKTVTQDLPAVIGMEHQSQTSVGVVQVACDLAP